jgi:hypothetical protein
MVESFSPFIGYLSPCCGQLAYAAIPDSCLLWLVLMRVAIRSMDANLADHTHERRGAHSFCEGWIVITRVIS